MSSSLLDMCARISDFIGRRSSLQWPHLYRGFSRGPSNEGGLADPKGPASEGPKAPVRKEQTSGCWDCEVVQRSEGFWIHPAGRRRGRIRALFCNLRRRLQDPGGGRAPGIRDCEGAEGPPGSKRPQGLIAFVARGRK